MTHDSAHGPVIYVGGGEFEHEADDVMPDAFGERARVLLVEALDMVPRISDDDPMAPALREWCREVRALTQYARGTP